MNKNWIKIGSLNLRKDLLTDIVMLGDLRDSTFTIFFKFNNYIEYQTAHFDNIGTARNRKSQLKKEIDEAVELKNSDLDCIGIATENRYEVIEKLRKGDIVTIKNGKVSKNDIIEIEMT